MKNKELKQMSKEQLKARLNELKKDLMKVHTQKSTGSTPENPGKTKQIKKAIARILTNINKKNNMEVKSKKP